MDLGDESSWGISAVEVLTKATEIVGAIRLAGEQGKLEYRLGSVRWPADLWLRDESGIQPGMDEVLAQRIALDLKIFSQKQGKTVLELLL